MVAGTIHEDLVEYMNWITDYLARIFALLWGLVFVIIGLVAVTVVWLTEPFRR